MLKKAVSKAAADGSTGGVASGYVEDAFEARTMLAVFFSILLSNRTCEVPYRQAIAKTRTLIAERVSVIIASLARIIHESL